MSGTQRALLVLFLPLLSFAANFDLSQPDPDGAGMNRERLAAIPVRMKEFVDEGKTSGVVTILARHGKLASFDAVGYQNIESKTPMRKDTMFRIASLTKPVTCAAIMILADEGRLSAIDPVEKFLPEYKGLKLNPCGARAGYNCEAIAPARPINLEDLMTHTSGLPASAQEGGGAHPGTLAELVTLGAKRQLLFEPGTHWSYSNLGIDILGQIVEVVSKQPFDTFLEERIFKPLGMTDTCFWIPKEKQTRLATLYTYENGGLKRAQAGPNIPSKIPSPAGGLISTASDMLRFNQMMRNGGELDGKRILSPWAVHLMTISHTGDMKAGWVPGVGHGYGYEVVRDAAGMFRYNSIGTFVKGGAYRTYEWVDPEKDMVGVFMMQLTNGGGDVADEINSFMQMAAVAIER
ncbi:MAG TPA: serine hydrolase domain-containing protein [Bryobacteraceae bacterium]|jgi:CubicO group peptidase (beta-lactamase class C family)|nr:serine hydrolase domain-containing protein [Bryobacteraceae bacterium]